MSPFGDDPGARLLEHPGEAFSYYFKEGVARVICEESTWGHAPSFSSVVMKRRPANALTEDREACLRTSDLYEEQGSESIFCRGRGHPTQTVRPELWGTKGFDPSVLKNRRPVSYNHAPNPSSTIPSFCGPSLQSRQMITMARDPIASLHR